MSLNEVPEKDTYMKKLSKGSKFCVVETAGKEVQHYNLFDIRGLSKG